MCIKCLYINLIYNFFKLLVLLFKSSPCERGHDTEDIGAESPCVNTSACSAAGVLAPRCHLQEEEMRFSSLFIKMSKLKE